MYFVSRSVPVMNNDDKAESNLILIHANSSREMIIIHSLCSSTFCLNKQIQTEIKAEESGVCETTVLLFSSACLTTLGENV